jgi:DNA repair exonuclease SbcCD ATPase subunit
MDVVRISLEAIGRVADRRRVSSPFASASRESVFQSQLGKLAECDESLTSIASDLTGLRDELAQLRAEADGLVRTLSERETLLAEKELVLSKLQHEQSRVQLQADAASTKLLEVDSQLRTRDERVTTLERELQELRVGIDERDRRLADAAAQLSGMRDALMERELAVEREHEHRASAALVAGHVRFIAGTDGYKLSESEESCSRPGDVVEIDGKPFEVVTIGRSPLPRDPRPCAFLQPRPGRRASI